MLHAQGGNFAIELEQGVVHCRVWKRPDVTHEEGAQLAAQKLEHLWRLAASPHEDVRAFVFDLRQAPFVGWINDLSAPDALFMIPGLGIPLRVLPLLNGAAMVVQQKISPAQIDPAQARMMMIVMPVMMRVPTMAWYAPPPSPRTPRIDQVKNSSSKRARPRLTTVHTTDSRGVSATRKNVVTSPVTTRSVACRRPSTARATK